MDLSCRARHPGRLACLLLILPLLLGACGGEADPPLASPPPRPAPAPSLDVPDDGARAAFALDRLLKGPLPRTGAFGIPRLHTLNLKHAQADLLALPEETLRLLGDAGMRRRLTSARAGSQNAWHTILDVLIQIEDAPADLVLAWTRDALQTTDTPLLRRAVRILSEVDDDRARDLLLEFLAFRPHDREIAGISGRVLVTAGSPWREQALRILYRRGSMRGWQSIPRWLDDAETGEDALVAWALIAETGAPRLIGDTSRFIHPNWYAARLLIDESVWPRGTSGIAASIGAGRLFTPATIEDGGGFIPAGAGASTVVETASLPSEGRLHAADARCRLARAGHTAAIASVEADTTGRDPDLAETARSCRRGKAQTADVDAARDLIEQFFSALDAGYPVGADGVAQALTILGTVDADGARDALLRILERARPRATYEALVEDAQAQLLSLDAAALRAWVDARLRGGDPEETALALRLIRRAPSVTYAPALLELERTSAGPIREEVRRVLVWVHAVAPDVDEEAREAFVPHVETWIEPMADRALVALLPGLLDLGQAGAGAYAQGLLGPRRALYVEALAGRPTLMPLEVAEALLTKVDGATSARERRQVLVAAYVGAPASAVTALAAARDRLDPTVRAEADDVLEVVRHRATR